MTEDIKRWNGTGRNFKDGVELLFMLQGESFLLSMLRTHGETIFNRKKLDAALDGYISTLSTDPEPAHEPERMPDDGIDFFKLPPDLQQLYFEKNKLYKDASYEHRRLKLFKGKEQEEPHGVVRIIYTGEQAAQRANAIEIIATGMKRNGDIWRQLDYFQQHGIEKKTVDEQPARLTSDDIPTDELILYRNRLQNWINKNKAKAKKMDDGEKKTILLSKILLKQVEFNEIEERYQAWKENR